MATRSEVVAAGTLYVVNQYSDNVTPISVETNTAGTASWKRK